VGVVCNGWLEGHLLGKKSVSVLSSGLGVGPPTGGNEMKAKERHASRRSKSMGLLILQHLPAAPYGIISTHTASIEWKNRMIGQAFIAKTHAPNFFGEAVSSLLPTEDGEGSVAETERVN